MTSLKRVLDDIKVRLREIDGTQIPANLRGEVRNALKNCGARKGIPHLLASLQYVIEHILISKSGSADIRRTVLELEALRRKLSKYLARDLMGHVRTTFGKINKKVAAEIKEQIKSGFYSGGAIPKLESKRDRIAALFRIAIERANELEALLLAGITEENEALFEHKFKYFAEDIITAATSTKGTLSEYYSRVDELRELRSLLATYWDQLVAITGIGEEIKPLPARWARARKAA